MKILVVGASRGIGRQTVKQALDRGHQVTALARHPEKIGLQRPHLKFVSADVMDAKALQKAMAGQEAVICTLGLPTAQAIGPPIAKRSYVLSTGTRNILTAMQAKKVKRLLCVTAIGSGDSVKQCTPMARLVLRYGLRWLFKEKDRQEALIQKSGLDWTIIRPTALTNGRLKGAKVEAGLPSGILTHVSRADVAAAILDLLDQPESYKKALAVSYEARFGDGIRWVAGYLGIA
jgi:uncharacterized protein YbjT (DUF2867 family)